MCDVYIVLYEGYLGPKAADLRVYPVIKCEGVSEETGATHDHSQVKKHGKSLWGQIYKFHLADPEKEVPTFDIEFFTKCKLRDDEMLASTMLSEETMRGFVFGPCKVHDVKLKMQSSEELSHYNLTSSISKKQHDYYIKYRLLVTGAGVEPPPKQLDDLLAPSPVFDMSVVKENEDNDEEKALDKATAVVAELNRMPVFRLIRQFIFAVVALAAAISGLIDMAHAMEAAMEGAGFKWELTRATAGDRCVSLFDQIDEVKNDNDTIIYSYGTGGAAVGVCTDRNQSAFDSEIGSKYLFDTVSDATGGSCTLPGYYAGTDNISCSFASSTEPCIDLSNEEFSSPHPYGIMWNEYADDRTTSDSQPPHDCYVNFAAASHDPNWASCTKDHVYVYRHVANKIVQYIGYAAFIIMYYRLYAELRGVTAFHMPGCAKLFCCCGPTCGYSGHKSVLYRMSSRGLFGPLSLLWQMVRGRTTRVPPIDPPPVPLDVALYLFEMIPNIALPLYSVWGCSANNWRFIIIVALGFVKTFIMTCIFGKQIVDRVVAGRSPEELDGLQDVLINTGDAGAYSPRSSYAAASSLQSVNGGEDAPTSDGFNNISTVPPTTATTAPSDIIVPVRPHLESNEAVIETPSLRGGVDDNHEVLVDTPILEDRQPSVVVPESTPPTVVETEHNQSLPVVEANDD